MRIKLTTCNFALLSSLRWASATYSGLLETILPFISESCNQIKRRTKYIIKKKIQKKKTGNKETKAKENVNSEYAGLSEKSTHSSRWFFSIWESYKSWSSTYTIRVTHDLLNKKQGAEISYKYQRRTPTTLNMLNSLSRDNTNLAWSNRTKFWEQFP